MMHATTRRQLALGGTREDIQEAFRRMLTLTGPEGPFHPGQEAFVARLVTSWMNQRLISEN